MSQVFVGFSGSWGTPNPYVFTGFRAPRVLWGLHTLRFSHVIWLLGCPGAPTPYVIGFRTPRVTWGLQTLGFTSCLARRGHWGSKTYCFHWCSGFSEAVGAPKPYVFHTYSSSSGDLGALKSGVFISVRAPRGPWGGELLDPRVPWELQNQMFLQVFVLLRGLGNHQNLAFFIGVRAPRGA